MDKLKLKLKFGLVIVACAFGVCCCSNRVFAMESENKDVIDLVNKKDNVDKEEEVVKTQNDNKISDKMKDLKAFEVVHENEFSLINCGKVDGNSVKITKDYDFSKLESEGEDVVSSINKYQFGEQEKSILNLSKKVFENYVNEEFNEEKFRVKENENVVLREIFISDDKEPSIMGGYWYLLLIPQKCDLFNGLDSLEIHISSEKSYSVYKYYISDLDIFYLINTNSSGLVNHLRNIALENLRKSCKDLKLDENLIYRKRMLSVLNKEFVEAFKKKFANFVAIAVDKEVMDSMRKESKNLSYDIFSQGNRKHLASVSI